VCELFEKSAPIAWAFAATVFRGFVTEGRDRAKGEDIAALTAQLLMQCDSVAFKEWSFLWRSF
jgi:hypothetical protein